MILTETYFIKEGDKKIFLISSINLPKEIKDSEFWIKYLEYEINIESKSMRIRDIQDTNILFLYQILHI